MKKGKLAVLLVLGLVAVSVMGADDSCSTEDATVQKSDKKGGGESSDIAKVGDKMTLKGTTYQVTSAKTAGSIGSGYAQETANGVFVVVDIKLTNEEDEPATIMEDMISLIGGNGNTYSTSTDATFALGDESLFLEEIQPGLTVKGKLVYDVPPKVVKGSFLQVEDLFSSSTGDIKLGL
jgi:hypothetical protein